MVNVNDDEDNFNEEIYMPNNEHDNNIDLDSVD